MSPTKVIVFGPTGAVGSAAARTAHSLGAPVVLAMRNTSKAIRGLDAATEAKGGFERVTADLSDPESVRAAVSQTQAKRAFIYVAHGTDMKPTIEALKAGGIELTVFLSSFTSVRNLRDITPDQFIAYSHARVELLLEEVVGANNFVALRAGSFASNTLQYKDRLNQGVVDLFLPENLVDDIVPEDIGRVAGTILAHGPKDEKRAIYLYGAELKTQRRAVEILAEVLGKEVKITSASEEDARKRLIEARGFSKALAEYFTSSMKRPAPAPAMFGTSVDLEDFKNVERYSGQRPTTLKEWAEQNKALFLN